MNDCHELTILGTLRHGREGSHIEAQCANWKSPHDLASRFCSDPKASGVDN